MPAAQPTPEYNSFLKINKSGGLAYGLSSKVGQDPCKAATHVLPTGKWQAVGSDFAKLLAVRLIGFVFVHNLYVWSVVPMTVFC